MISKKATLEKWFQRVWAEEDTTAIHEMFVPEVSDDKAHGISKDAGLGPDDFVGFQQALLTLIKDINISIDAYSEKGDTLFAECTMTAYSRKTNSTEPITIKGCVVGKIVDGKILAANNHFDFLHLFESLGLLPEDTFEKCLRGTRVIV